MSVNFLYITPILSSRQKFYDRYMTTQYLSALILFAVIVVLSFLFQVIIILDFRATLKKRSAFYTAIGSPESAGSWRALSLWYVLVVVVLSLVTGLLLIFQPHLY